MSDQNRPLALSDALWVHIQQRQKTKPKIDRLIVHSFKDSNSDTILKILIRHLSTRQHLN